MTLKKSTDLYEVLVRFGPDGFVGAHVIEAETVHEGKDVLAFKELPARPVTKAEIGGLLGANTAKLIEAADIARAERDQALTDRNGARVSAERAETERSQIEGERNALADALADARKRVDDLTAQLAAAQAAKADA